MIQDRPVHSENSDDISSQDLIRARRLGLIPSKHLRRHFIALARAVRKWSSALSRPVSVGITSLERRVGRSTIAFNLSTALTTVANDRVLLVEADFGRSPIARRLVKTPTMGLCEILQSRAEPVDCILSTPLRDLAVLGCGTASEKDGLDISFDSLSAILEDKLNQFGYLVFDLPIADDLSSFYSIAPHLSGVILAVDSGQIDERQIQRAKRRFLEYGIQIIGMVINRT